jgi:hypothetical protein
MRESIVVLKKMDVEVLMELHNFRTLEYENVVYMRKYCNGEQIGLKILAELHVFTTPEYSDFFNAICGHVVALLVEALCCKPGGHRFDS